MYNGGITHTTNGFYMDNLNDYALISVAGLLALLMIHYAHRRLLVKLKRAKAIKRGQSIVAKQQQRFQTVSLTPKRWKQVSDFHLNKPIDIWDSSPDNKQWQHEQKLKRVS